MGSGFGELFAAIGIPTVVVDSTPERADAGRTGALERARHAEDEGWRAPGSADRVASCLGSATSAGEAARDADLVIEAVTEDPDVKLAVYREVEEAARPETVLATNTSAIPVAKLAQGLRRPERFLGTHWFNPPQWVPCVEVIAAPATEPEVVERVTALLTRAGKRPVPVGDGPGFVANRLQLAMFREAVAVVEAGLASPEAVDEVVRSSFGFRLPFFGPFLIADMAGLDTHAGAYRAIEAVLGPSWAPPTPVREMVEAGRLGTKVGKGYLPHDPERLPELLERRDAAYVALGRLLDRLAMAGES
jgi:3-hydroxybutyryl-CoA dehydrogenase